jgi:hypothetical protein
MTERQVQLAETLLGAMNHRTGAALLGSGAGAIAGALMPDKGKKRRLRRAALGGLLGAGLGYGGARAFPQQSQELNDFLVKNLIAKPVGRVVTNTIAPVGYTDKAQELSKDLKKNPRAVWDAIKTDTPLWKSDPDASAEWLNKMTDSRELPYRRMFGLKERGFAEKHTQNSNGTFKLGPESEASLQKDLKFQSSGEENHIDDSALGNVVLNPVQGGKIKYRDRWDLDLNPGERPNTPVNIMRAVMSKITSPVVFEGELDDPRFLKDAAAARWQSYFA